MWNLWQQSEWQANGTTSTWDPLLKLSSLRTMLRTRGKRWRRGLMLKPVRRCGCNYKFHVLSPIFCLEWFPWICKKYESFVQSDHTFDFVFALLVSSWRLRSEVRSSRTTWLARWGWNWGCTDDSGRRRQSTIQKKSDISWGTHRDPQVKWISALQEEAVLVFKYQMMLRCLSLAWVDKENWNTWFWSIRVYCQLSSVRERLLIEYLPVINSTNWCLR